METTTNTGKNKKIQRKNDQRKCRSPLNQKLFSENFIHDPLNILSKPVGNI